MAAWNSGKIRDVISTKMTKVKRIVTFRVTEKNELERNSYFNYGNVLALVSATTFLEYRFDLLVNYYTTSNCFMNEWSNWEKISVNSSTVLNFFRYNSYKFSLGPYQYSRNI